MLIDELRIYKNMRREAPFGDDVEVTISIIRDAQQAGVLLRSDLFYIDEICRKAEQRAKKQGGKERKNWKKRQEIHSGKRKPVIINLLPVQEDRKPTGIRLQRAPSDMFYGTKK